MNILKTLICRFSSLITWHNHRVRLNIKWTYLVSTSLFVFRGSNKNIFRTCLFLLPKRDEARSSFHPVVLSETTSLAFSTTLRTVLKECDLQGLHKGVIRWYLSRLSSTHWFSPLYFSRLSSAHASESHGSSRAKAISGALCTLRVHYMQMRSAIVL